MQSDLTESVVTLIQLFREAAAEGKMMIIPSQFRTSLQYDPIHHSGDIRLEYVCMLNAASCAMMSDRLVEKIIEAGLDTLPIICSFTNVKDEVTEPQPSTPNTIPLHKYAELTGISVNQLLKLVKPEFLHVVIPK